MNIVWISHKGNLKGGAELSLVEAAKGLIGAGHQVHVVSPYQGPLCDVLEALGVTISIIPFDRWTKGIDNQSPKVRLLRRYWSASNKISGLLHKIGASIVVTNTIVMPVGALAAQFARIPHVWYIHERFGATGHDLFFEFGNRLSLATMDWLSDRIIVNSRSTLQVYARYVPARKLRVVYYSVDTPSERQPAQPQSDGTLRLIQVGTLNAGKRPDDAIRAVALLTKKGLRVKLMLVGHEVPDYGTFLRQLAQGLSVQVQVEFIPFTDPFPYFVSADVALLCSKGEGFGRVTVEAMKMGIPVIGADSGATAELIQDGINGLLYRVGDVADLVQKIETLYHDRMLLKAMGQTAQEWAGRKFCTQAYMSDLLSVFEEALAGPAKPGRWQALRGTAGRDHSAASTE